MSHLSSLGLLAAPRNVYRASALQRVYRKILDEARDGPVPVLDKDDQLLGVELWSDLAFNHGVVAALQDVRQFAAVYARHLEEEPREWAAMTPYPWLAVFDKGEAAQFSGDLMAYLFESVHRKSLDAFIGNLRAWESSAETFENEEMLATLEVDIAREELFEIHPPSEDDAAASQAAEASRRRESE